MEFLARQRLSTLLLGTFALWGLAVAVATWTGLGGRYALHPDDASRVPELPRLDLSRAQNPLQPLDAYAVVGERPLFNADRKPLPPPEAPAAGAETAPPPPLDVVLTSVVMTGDMRIAIVLDKKANKTQSVRLGDSLAGEQAGWKLVELEPRRAVFEGPTGRNEAALRVFDGQGGEAPTPTAAVGTPPEGGDPAQPAADAPQTPETRAELIRRRIEERRRQMREEAERANKENQN